MKTRVGWLCGLALVLMMTPSWAYGGAAGLTVDDVGRLLGLKEIVGVPALIQLLGGDRLAFGPPTGSVERAVLSPPGVVSRREWGAEERLRFRRGRLRTRPAFVPVRKLIVHHTATRTWEPPRRAIRRIYRSHTLARGFADIGYHYLISADGRVFKGRYSGPPGTRRQDRPWADRDERFAVRGAHALAANGGTVGIALLGNYERASLRPKARSALVRLLAWLSNRYGIDPLGSSRYPRGDGRLVRTRNIAGHRAYGRTVCPGEAVQRELPAIRRDVARQLREAARAQPDARGPLIYEVRIAKVGRRGAVVRWTTDEPSSTVVSMRPRGSARASTTVRWGLTTRHRVRVAPLRRDTEYVFRLGGADARGNGAWSAPQSLRTRR